MKPKRSMKTLTASIILLALVACQKTEPTTEGPAEKVGQKIDQATSQASVHINSIAEKAGQGLAKVGEKMQGAAKDAQMKNDQKETDPQAKQADK